jgi:hypothetical protein
MSEKWQAEVAQMQVVAGLEVQASATKVTKRFFSSIQEQDNGGYELQIQWLCGRRHKIERGLLSKWLAMLKNTVLWIVTIFSDVLLIGLGS